MSGTIRLEIVEGVDRGKTAEVGGIAILGRDAECSFQLNDPTVSRQHAVIRPDDDDRKGFVLEAVKGGGPLHVNGVPARRTSLRDGDLIRLGSVELRVRHIGERRLEGEVPPEDVDVVQTRDLPTLRYSLDALNFQLGARDLMGSGIGDIPQDAPDPADGNGMVTGEVAAKLEQLVEISIGMTTIHEPQAMMRATASRLFTMFPQVRRLAFFELEEDLILDTKILRTRFLIDRSQRSAGQRVQVSQSVVNKAMQERKALLSENVTLDPRFDLSESLSEGGVCSMICAPLMLGERVLGALYLDSTDPNEQFDEGALRLVTGVAAIVASALENMRLFTKIQAEGVKRSNLERYFAPNLVERVMKGEVPLARQGRFATGTILFVDIRGFTRLTELTEPQVLVETLNEYFSAMQRIIFRSGGTVERFGGDSILAYWGVVEQDAHAAARATRAALAMHTEIYRINPQLEALGRPRLRIAIGLNSGDVVVGDVGSAERYEFTILGTAINLARRLESLAGPWEVIAGAATVQSLGPGTLQVPLPPAMVKGMDEAVALSAIYGLKRPDGAAGAFRYDLALEATLDVGQGPEVTLIVGLEASSGGVDLEVLTAFLPEHDAPARIAFCLPRTKGWFTALGAVFEEEQGGAEETMTLDASSLTKIQEDLTRLERYRIRIQNAPELLAYLGVPISDWQ